jgi:hypothetical protein
LNDEYEKNFEQTYHVESLEGLTLVARTIAGQHKCAVLPTHVLLNKTHTSPNLAPTIPSPPKNDGVKMSIEPSFPKFSMGDAYLATKEFADNTLDGPTTHDGEGWQR